MQALLAGDWREHYFIERCEFPGILAIHFVVYGILGRGVSSSTILDSLGKGFAGAQIPVSLSLVLIELQITFALGESQNYVGSWEYP